jgi:hypothetical protein
VLSVAALLISAAALLVACASVYWTNLAPAQIELDHLRQPDELVIGAFDPQPESHEVWLAFFISNAGARGGFLERVEVTEIAVREGGLWTGPGSTAGPLPQRGAPPSHSLGAIALEAGDVRTIWLQVRLDPALVGPEQQAREFRALESVALTVECTFRRSRGLGRWRGREQVTRTIDVEVDASGYRNAAVARWRSLAQYAHLADIAEGRAEPPT